MGSMQRKERVWTVSFLAVGTLLLLFLLITRPAPPLEPQLPHLQRIIDSGVLRVATVNSPVTYYQLQDQDVGFEYDLAKLFAEQLGVSLQIITVPHYQELFNAVNNGLADIAAASITVTAPRLNQVQFGPAYLEVTQEVIYRSGQRRPRELEDLGKQTIGVISGSSYSETLTQLRENIPSLRWKEDRSGNIESLFEAISKGDLDLTIADSNILAIHQRFYPSLKRAFSISSPQPIAWALPLKGDASLMNELQGFFARVENQGQLEDLSNRYLSHVETYDKINTHYFLRHIDSRLPDIQGHFERAAGTNGFDWKLLAAMGYQESHWKSDATSKTGVRGLMMLTRATASQLGIEDRLDPEQSIEGGARYLARMKSKIPERIAEPDRTWLALAAYNVGFGHLEDARIITQRRGGNPDKWSDVAKSLPLLSDRQWFNQARHGYARGREPVNYVHNVRSYYDVLVWRLNRIESASLQNTAP
jgi:membrane-bound lytic murein transglycosylase F